MAAAQSEEFLRYASGGGLPAGSEPLAHRYGGHQVSSGVHLIQILSTVFQRTDVLSSCASLATGRVNWGMDELTVWASSPTGEETLVSF